LNCSFALFFLNFELVLGQRIKRIKRMKGNGSNPLNPLHPLTD
jgi:hypothetical protein